jgi:hypothetical protein
VPTSDCREEMLDDKNLLRVFKKFTERKQGYFDRFIFVPSQETLVDWLIAGGALASARFLASKLGPRLCAALFDAYPALQKFFLLICDKV